MGTNFCRLLRKTKKLQEHIEPANFVPHDNFPTLFTPYQKAFGVAMETEEGNHSNTQEHQKKGNQLLTLTCDM